MPNIKSAKKRVLVIDKKTLENRMVKSAIKTELKKFEAAVSEGNKASAQELYNLCAKKLFLDKRVKVVEYRIILRFKAGEVWFR